MRFWKSRRRKLTRRQRLQRGLRWSLALLMALILLETGFILGLQPDWDQFTRGPLQKSRFIQDYEYRRSLDRALPPLRWHPVAIETMPRHLIRAVIVAEDSRFFEHQGFDRQAFLEAMEANLARGRIAYGGSTISQQTVKNYLLSPSRNPLRKLHEAILTWNMERHVGKNRIMEIYLNSAEFGRGIYGVDAAARHYWGIPVGRLSRSQAVELAATLPAPVGHNPATRTSFFDKRRRKILRHLGQYGNAT